MSTLPALSLAAMPGRRRATVELASEIERRGFPGIYCASFGDGLGLCLSLAFATKTLRFGTAIANIYARTPFDMAQSAGFVHELSDGRFTLGLGVSHAPVNQRLGVETGRPLADMRRYVETVRSQAKQVGALPPIVLATLRRRMVSLAAEIGDGAVFANAARSHMPASLREVPKERLAAGFFVGNMIPTCIDDDRAAAAAVNRKTLSGYLLLPNYRNYWKEAGYEEEMAAVEAALAKGERDALPGLMSDRWLADTTLFGSAAQVRDGLEAWREAGVTTPIVVPSSTRGGQMKAFEEVMAALA
ncbi:MAG TPA: LLM class flavin-dependent oxidoreductase [Myxococcota bacterium]|nr:LLM class flavin-dependent oxidoreductase [Myxococcota bacterium]